MTSIQQLLTEKYKSLVGREVETRMLRYWMNSVAQGASTVDGILQTIVESDDYKKHLVQRFKERYFELIGYEDDVSKACAAFVNEFAGKEAGCADIDRHIKKMPIYREKLIAKITSCFAMSARPDSVNASVTEFYIKMFQERASYSLEELQRHVDEGYHAKKTRSRGVQPPPSYKEAVKDSIISPFSTPPAQAPPVAKKNIEPPSALQTDKLELFERVFDRPMFVKEYFAYVIDEAPGTTSWTQEGVATLKASHAAAYDRVRFINANYLGVDLDEWQFVDKFLAQTMSSPTFYKDYVEDIVESPTYEQVMKAIIDMWNKKFYDSSLNLVDLDFVFRRVKAKRLHMQDDVLTEEIRAFRDETDGFVESINDVFNEVLGRNPCEKECDVYLKHYRIRVPTSSVDLVSDGLCSKLIRTKEFDDVIKKQIKEVALNEEISLEGGELYEHLENIVNKIKMNPEATLGDVKEYTILSVLGGAEAAAVT